MLDVACGGGRHVRACLAVGLQVVGVDRDPAACAELVGRPGFRFVQADLEAETESGSAAWPLGGEQFDAVLVTNYLWRPLFASLRGAVAEGGLLLYETFARGHEAYGRPRRPEFQLEAGELLDLVSGAGAGPGGFVVAAYEHGLVDRGGAPRKQAWVQRIAARRSADPIVLSE